MLGTDCTEGTRAEAGAVISPSPRPSPLGEGEGSAGLVAGKEASGACVSRFMGGHDANGESMP